MADQEKKQYLSEDEMGFGAAAKPPKYLSEADMGLGPADGGFVASAKQSVGSLIKGAGQAAADFIPGVSQGNAVQRYGQSVIDANPTAVHSLSDIADKPVAAVKEAAGNAAGSIGGMIGARVLGNAITAAAPLTGPAAPVTAAVGQGVAWLGPWAAAALPSFGGIRDQQVKDDPSKQDSIGAKALAAAGAGTVGLIENKFGPQEWALRALSQEGRKQLAEKFAAKSLVGSIGKGVAKGAAVEGAEELAQNPIEQLASYQNPTTADNLQDTAFSGVMGALGGGVFGGGMGAASRIVGGEGNKPAPQPDPADQASPTLALPAPPPSTGTPGEQLAASDAERAAQVTQAEARAADIYRQRDEFDATRQANLADAPLPFDPSPAEELAAQRKAAMGIDPAAGPLSAGAAIAVETQAAEEVRLGAAAMLAEGAARAQQAQAERAAWEAANPGIPYEPVAAAPASNKPAPSAAPSPSGSFGAMNDFAELLSQERQDVAQRRAGIAERQGQRRDFDLAEADRRTAESMQREAQARRRAVLDSVLSDPETKNPAGRFAAMLRREGYRDSAPTEDELRTIQRFEDVRAAKPAPPEMEPSAPNELDPAALGIRERRAPAAKEAPTPPRNLREGMARAQAARAAEGGSMPTASQPSAAPSVDPGKAWASLSTKQRTDLAGRLQGVPPIVSKNVPRAEWGKINPALRTKLAEAMQPRAAGQEAIDSAAHEAATSPRNDRAQPTEAQAKAGNYKKGHVSIGGLDIAIENPEGSTRSGIDPGGKPWSVTMSAHYGYVKRTQGADGDQVDVYLGKADPVSGPVFVVDQFDNRTGKFDEHKAILGAKSLKEAQALYDAHFSDGKGPARRGAITSMSFDAFKDWAKNGNTTMPLGQRTAAPSVPAATPSQRDGADENQNPIKAESPAVAGPAEEMAPADQEAAQAPPAGPAAAEEASGALESLFAGLDSTSPRKRNKARRAAAKHPQAARIEYVQENFHDLLMQMMDAGVLEVNGTTTLTEDNASCL